jgi:crotonobetainyl-CoA:carnitine CoA-transferase CaiB-like acyl-CoA transferase
MKPVLDGVRVIELSTMITAPLAGMMLADFGADVIKVEQPVTGDPYRNFRGGQYSPHFCAYNRNKRSVVLDLRDETGRARLTGMLEAGDVLLENFRPGVMARLGFDDARIKAINPRLVHCSITGFGPDGPYRERPAYDAVAQALSGLSSLQIDPANPRVSGPTIADNVTGQVAAFGIVSALFERERTGVARRVEVNMLDAALAFIPDPYGYLDQMGLVSDAWLRARTSQSYVFACSDARMLSVHLSSQDKFWQGFLKTMERPDLQDDARFATRALRIEHYDALAAIAAEVFRRHDRGTWLARLEQNDVPFAPVYDVTEVAADAQVRHLGSFFDLHHPVAGRLNAIRRPIWLDGQRDDQPAIAPPLLGEHTQEVLDQFGLG